MRRIGPERIDKEYAKRLLERYGKALPGPADMANALRREMAWVDGFIAKGTDGIHPMLLVRGRRGGLENGAEEMHAYCLDMDVDEMRKAIPLFGMKAMLDGLFPTMVTLATEAWTSEQAGRDYAETGVPRRPSEYADREEIVQVAALDLRARAMMAYLPVSRGAGDRFVPGKWSKVTGDCKALVLEPFWAAVDQVADKAVGPEVSARVEEVVRELRMEGWRP